MKNAGGEVRQFRKSMSDSMKNAISWAVVFLFVAYLMFKPHAPPAPSEIKSVYVSYQGAEQDVARFNRWMTVALDAHGFRQAGAPSAADAVIDISIDDVGKKEQYPVYITTLQADFALSGGRLYRQESCVGIMPKVLDTGIRVTSVAAHLKKDHPDLARVFTGEAKSNENSDLLAIVSQELKENGFEVVSEKAPAQAILRRVQSYRHPIYVAGRRQTLTLNMYSPTGRKDFGRRSNRTMFVATAMIDKDPQRSQLCSIYLDPYLERMAPQVDDEFLRAVLPAFKYIDEVNNRPTR